MKMFLGDRRRAWTLAAAVAVLAPLVLVSTTSARGTAHVQPNAIARENARTGTPTWFIDTPAQGKIDGYANDVSYVPGDTVTLYVNSHGDPFSYTVYRMGYYDGLGGRTVANGKVTANGRQPAPVVTDDRSGGAKLLTTRWHRSGTIPVGADWVSGWYLVKLHNDVNGGESYANFTVRSATPAPIVINLSTNTWQAYNRWHDLSLYRDARAARPKSSSSDVAHQVSFRRPYREEWGAGKFFLFDRPLVEWAESHGYPVSYSTDEDLRLGRAAGPQTKLVIFSGHEEYYSLADRDELLRLTASGVSQAFFGGNAWAWQARFDDTSHVMTVWRTKALDPVPDLLHKTVRWEVVGLPQNQLTGTLQTWGKKIGAQRAYAADSWPWNGAGVLSGADLGSLEGTEFDGIGVNYLLARHLLMLGRTPQLGMPHIPANQAMTLWQKTPLAFVFSAGQTGFNWNLSYPGVTPSVWISPKTYPESSQVKPAIARLAGNLIQRATGIANPIPPVKPTGEAAPFAILAPQAGQYVMASPNPLSVSWSDPPARTASIRVYVDGTQIANRKPVGNVLVAGAVRRLGPHTIRVVALTRSHRVLAKVHEPIMVLDAKNEIFRRNAQRLRRLWGEDDSDEVAVEACFVRLSP